MRIVLLLVSSLLWFSCGAPRNSRPTVATALPTRDSSNATSEEGSAPSSLDTTSAGIRALGKFFRVEKERGNGIYLQAYIYISDTSKLVAINTFLRMRYRSRFTEALDIWYFDKPHMVDRYLSAVDDQSVSDDAFDRLDRHMVCQYSQLREGVGTLDWNKH